MPRFCAAFLQMQSTAALTLPHQPTSPPQARKQDSAIKKTPPPPTSPSTPSLPSKSEQVELDPILRQEPCQVCAEVVPVSALLPTIEPLD